MKAGLRSSEKGLGLLEVLVAGAVLSTALLALLSVSAHSIKLDSVNRETAAASAIARMRFEEVRAVPLMNVFASYNADDLDDPGGLPAPPGSKFTHSGTGEKMAVTGVYIFPVNNDGELREDLDMPELGMPRDLNGDGLIDDLDHRDDYVILPMTVRLTWRGATGEREFKLTGVLLP